MSNPLNQLNALLRQYQFQLVRQNKHHVYRNPEGKIFVTPATPSDFRWAGNALRVLKRVIASPAVPEIIAIYEYEREQAAEKIAAEAKEPGPGHSKQRSSGGTGYSYVQERKIIWTQSPEKRQYERDLRQWQDEVWKAQQQFVQDVIRKAKPLLAKAQEDGARRHQVLVDRYRWYADNKLKSDVARYHKALDAKDDAALDAALDACSPLFDDILRQHQSEGGEGFLDRVEVCKACLNDGDDRIRLCFEHLYEKSRTIALNMGSFTRPDAVRTVDEYRKLANSAFRDAMHDEEKFWEDADRQMRLLECGLLLRYALRKLRPLTQELLRTRPVKPVREVVEVGA